MTGCEESLSGLECSVHLPLSPQLISPVTQPGTQQVGVSQDHHRGLRWGVEGRGIRAHTQDEVVHQELVVHQPNAEYAEEAEKLSSDSFQFDLEQSPWDN